MWRTLFFQTPTVIIFLFRKIPRLLTLVLNLLTFPTRESENNVFRSAKKIIFVHYKSEMSFGITSRTYRIVLI